MNTRILRKTYSDSNGKVWYTVYESENGMFELRDHNDCLVAAYTNPDAAFKVAEKNLEKVKNQLLLG